MAHYAQEGDVIGMNLLGVVFSGRKRELLFLRETSHQTQGSTISLHTLPSQCF